MRKRIVVLGLALVMLSLVVIPVGSLQARQAHNKSNHGTEVSGCVRDMIEFCAAHSPRGMRGICTASLINRICFDRTLPTNGSS